MNETIELQLEGIAPTGEAVGSHPQTGKPILVADAIPGERVEVTFSGQRARLLRVIEASPDRVTPPCPYFGPPQPVTLPDGTQLNPDGVPRCAGCLWQHIAYDRQLALKREIVLQALAPLPDLGTDSNGRPYRPERLVAEVIALGDPVADEEVALDYHYLTQMTFALDVDGNLCLPTRPADAAMPPLLPIEFCLLHHPQLADLFAAFAVDEETGRELAQELLSVEMSVGATAPTIEDDAKGMLVLETRSGEAPSLELGLPVNVLVRSPGTNEVAAVDLLVGDWSFPVALGAEQMLGYPPMGGTPLIWPHAIGEEAIGTIMASVLEVQPFEHGIHLWAGAGLVSRLVAAQVSTLIAIEENELAVAALQANTAGADNVDIHSGPVPRILDNLRRGGYETNVALLTPRGDAIDESILRHLNTLGIARFALICEDPAEILRLVPLAQAERYELVTIQPVDLQPQQESVLLIVRFDRRR